MKKTLIFILLSVIVYIVYFNTVYRMPECRNSNSMFDKYSPESKEYRNELRIQIEKVGVTNLHYWVYKLIKINNEDYLKVYVQSENLCAILFAKNLSGKMHLNDKSKNFEVEGFQGRPLLDVKLNIEINNDETNFTIVKIGTIPDL